jgi:3-hydroxyisobutyrate dehydrogenase-like beta-hydroxyacid dehydrogenase
VDHTTASADLARELSAACASDVGFVDAPVSGGQAGAERGALTVMCGADDVAVFERVREVIDAYAAACERLGPAGAGQLTKMVNQICIAGIVQGSGRGVSFAQRAGLDVDRWSTSSARVPRRAGRWTTGPGRWPPGEFDFGFAVEWMRKDLAICLEEAARNGARLPVAALVDQFYAHVEQRGGARWDTSSLVQLLQDP